MKKILSVCIVMLLFSFCGITSNAQETAAEDVINLAQTNKTLDKMITKLSSGKISSKETSELLQELNQIQSRVDLEKNTLKAASEKLQKKIDALGAAPEAGETEPTDITRQRKEFNKISDTYKIQTAQADLIKAKIEEINTLILQTRNQELLKNILVKQSSIFHPQEFWTSLVSFAKFTFDLAKSPLSWYAELSETQKNTVNSNIIAVAFSMFAALTVAVYLNLYIKKWFGYRAGIEIPNYSQKFRAAIAMFIARGLIPAAVIGAFLIWLNNTQIISNGNFGLLLKNIAVYMLYYYLAKAIVKVTFTPSGSRWRIIEVDDNRARTVSSTLIFAIAAICSVSFFQTLAKQISSDPEIIYSLKIFANGVKAFCIILVARRFLYTDRNLNDEEISDDENINELSTSSKVCILICLAIGAAFVLSLFGYIRLSEFIINRFIVSALTIGVFYIIDKLIRVLFHQLLLFRFWIRTFRINRRSLVKTEFWFGLLLTPLLGILCLLSLLAVWGVSVDILINKVKSFLIGFNIGGIHISITSILLGIVAFFISLSLFKMLKSSLENGKLSKIEMEDGVRSSFVALISFIGFIFSVIIAIAVMGGSLSSITIIAGAMSFGVGLGLQNMVSNLVAGITILFERPIKIGDWVVINNYEGIVKHINMRSTELETGSKSSIIIPNSDILSKSLINLTYSNRMGRVEVKVGVDYDCDIELVKNTLLKIAAETKGILNTPAPSVAIADLADSSLTFKLSGFLSNVYNRGSIADDVREKIVTEFRKLNINIPYPQMVVHLLPEQIDLLKNKKTTD